MTVGSKQVQLMEVYRIQSLSLRIVGISLRCILKSCSHFVSLTCWTPSDPAVAWIYLYFSIFAPAVRPRAKLCKPYIQRFAMLVHKPEHRLIDLRIRLDMMTATKVRWTPYRLEVITNNLKRLPRSVQLPTTTPITPYILVNMIFREVDRDNVDDATKIGRISDLIKKYNQSRR
ncbi:hypothetical protein M9H77_20597 [Catharanthus roseus]|uniref:Uncharacterized protein n=1 Tax=Catharanthus roseus TaxID=4058 RepID=A0ACC0AM86_CATRO|nr:hypothetical protein M9H77_20597 [Catharanthus roseus]